jgi:hypothetical protein
MPPLRSLAHHSVATYLAAMAKNKAVLLTLLAVTAGNAATLSYTGVFTGDGDVQLFSFTIPSANTVTIQSFSFAGGVNGAGTTIPGGGFSPDIWLFDPTGTLLLADSPESPHHAAPGDCGPRGIDAATGFCWDAYSSALLPAGSYTLALTQDGNDLADGFSLAGGFTEQGIANYTDVNSLGGMFYLPDGVTARDGNWALDISGLPATTIPEPNTSIAVLALVSLLIYRRR